MWGIAGNEARCLPPNTTVLMDVYLIDTYKPPENLGSK